METLDITGAAKFLRMSPEVVRRKTRAGIIPGAKTGKGWTYLEDDLVKYVRSLYSDNAKTLQDKHRSTKKCQSINAMKHGGLQSAIKEDEYNNLLGLQTRR